MSLLRSSKTVPNDLHTHLRPRLNESQPSEPHQRPLAGGRHPLSCSVPASSARPVSESPFKQLSPSISASANLHCQASRIRHERMAEVATLAEQRRRQACQAQRSASFSHSHPPELPLVHETELSDDPTEWSPRDLARHLACVLGLVSKALISDLRKWACREGLDGSTFICLSDEELSRMGMSAGWTKTMIESRDRLRSKCHQLGALDLPHRFHPMVNRAKKSIGAFSFELPQNRPRPSPLRLSLTAYGMAGGKQAAPNSLPSSPLRNNHAGSRRNSTTQTMQMDPAPVSYGTPPPPDPKDWLELGSFLLWATLGLTLVTARVAIKAIFLWDKRFKLKLTLFS